jgi:glycosyltransferase involved in cell wall biosynthesis
LILVDDGATGLVAPPEPKALGLAIDRLAAERDRARLMGEAGYERVMQLEISWDRVVACLTA